MALTGLAVVVAVGVVGLWPRADRITRENSNRIREGMCRAEVEAILGPPGDYRTALGETEGVTPQAGATVWRSDDDGIDRNPTWRQGERAGVWLGDTILVLCILDDSDHVKGILVLPRRTTQKQTAFENLLWRLKRKWRRWFPE